jgi:hypothetical protein
VAAGSVVVLFMSKIWRCGSGPPRQATTGQIAGFMIKNAES